MENNILIGTRVDCLYRVSTDKQVDYDDKSQADIPMQRRECHRFCEKMGWTIVHEEQEDGVSGHKVRAENRDKLQIIKERAKQGKFDILLVFMFDRIGRIADETPFVVEWFVKNGIRVWSTQEGEQRFDTHTDKLTNYIRFWQADGESEKTSIRTKTALGQLVEDGGFKGDGPVIQQSLFAKQQMENIAKARREAPPLASYERIAEERSKRIYAPRDKSMQKAENLAKKMAKEGGGERMTQVNIDQAISQVTPRKPYIAPPMKLLIPPEPEISQNEDYEYKKQVICDTLRFFGVESEVVEIKVGPTFSLYTLHVEMPKGKSVSSLENYENDIAMKMEEESVRILAPIPGKNAVGIEVPNKKRRIVRLSEILQSPKFNQSASPATFGLGKDLYGQEYVCDIKELPHMLIAGATGAGKSCCINSLIISLLYKASPEEVRLIMVDPKRVELSVYAGIPHLMLDEIICDVDKAIRALNWAIAEMQRRIEYLSQLRYRDIDEYNQNCEKEGYEKMPRIVLIVDELADLMAQGKKAVEDAINRIARLARAVGIHLILATQRPSVDVVSGTIKNNLPSRVAFKVTSLPDSRTILDAGGAEKLLGNGDLFYMTPKIATPIRMQGAFISNSEVKSVVEFLKANNESYYDEKVKDAIFNEKSDEPAESPKGGGKNKEAQGGIPSEVFAAVRMGLEGNPITISGMQRRLGLGFPKAAKIFDLMRDMHLIEPTEDGKKHKVCITEEELEELENGGNADGENEE